MLKILQSAREGPLRFISLAALHQQETMIEYGFYIIQRDFAHFCSFWRYFIGMTSEANIAKSERSFDYASDGTEALCRQFFPIEQQEPFLSH